MRMHRETQPLTPTRRRSEEAGARLCDALVALDQGSARTLQERLREEAWTRGFTYDKDEGARDVIPLMVTPVVLSRSELAKLAAMAHGLRRILERVLPAALDDPALRALVPLEPEEDELLRRSFGPQHARDLPFAARLDVDVDFTDPDWPTQSTFYEFNGVAVGGLYYAMASEHLMRDVVFAALGAHVAAGLVPGQAVPQLILEELREHGRRIGRPNPSVGYIEDRSWTTGITEGPSLVDYFRAHGMDATLGDPRDLELVHGELVLGGHPIDILYRNMELRDLLDVLRSHGPIPALDKAFRENRVVSGLLGDIDHKSVWELLHSPAVQRALTPAERRFVAGHIPWTRIARQTRTLDPRGCDVDLPAYASKHRASLVVKPNRDCGGRGVVLGPRVTSAEWEKAIELAFAQEGRWVLQTYCKTARRRFATSVDHHFTSANLYTNYGLVSSPGGFGCLGRASSAAVVNVSQGGGVFPIFVRER